PQPAAKRLLLAGSMPPDERLHEAAEAAGASIVAESHALALGRLGREIDEASLPASADARDEPVRALAKHLRATSLAPRAFLDRGALVAERARGARADGVVIWLTREDEALAWTAPAQRRALSAAGLPVLPLTARRWQADDDTSERMAEFIRRCASATA